MDRNLVKQLKEGNKKAFEQLVGRHKRMAYQVALGLVGNKDDAHDISQEAFLRVYRFADKFDEKQPFLPWFYSIISNLSKTWLKRRSTYNKRNTDIENVAHILRDKDDPAENYQRKEDIKELNKALLKLSFQDREIINLQHFRGMTYDEIASLLDLPRGTVMSRLYYARKKLAGLLSEHNA